MKNRLLTFLVMLKLRISHVISWLYALLTYLKAIVSTNSIFLSYLYENLSKYNPARGRGILPTTYEVRTIQYIMDLDVYCCSLLW